MNGPPDTRRLATAFDAHQRLTPVNDVGERESLGVSPASVGNEYYPKLKAYDERTKKGNTCRACQ
jgi:hypothetical protein